LKKDVFNLGYYILDGSSELININNLNVPFESNVFLFGYYNF